MDDIVIFDILSREAISKIVEIQVNHVRERLLAKNIGLEVTPAVMEYLAKEGYNPQYGARPLKRIIQNKILTPVASQIIGRTVGEGCTVLVDIKDASPSATLEGGGKEFVFDVRKPKSTRPIKSEVVLDKLQV